MAANRKKYNLPTVERMELSEKHFSLRAILAAVLIAAALAVLGAAIFALTRTEPGWQAIESDGSKGIHCGGDFELRADVSGAAARKRLSMAWTEATAKAYAMFSLEDIVSAEGTGSVGTVNARAGEDVRVDEALYRALKTADEGGRWLYLAPLYDVQRSLSACRYDHETASFDALQDPDVRAFCGRAAAFARDPEAARLVFTAPDTVRLELSEEYAAFLRENGCPGALDFGWMKNAFVIDYLADCVTQAGGSRAVITSCDGFVRALDDGARTAHSLPLYEAGERGLAVRSNLRARYAGSAALAVLTRFAPDPNGSLYFYVFKTDGTAWRAGDTRLPYIDPRDGLAHAALPYLVGADENSGCAEVLMRLLPAYIADEWNPDAVEGAALVWQEDDGEWIASGDQLTLEGAGGA